MARRGPGSAGPGAHDRPAMRHELGRRHPRGRADPGRKARPGDLRRSGIDEPHPARALGRPQQDDPTSQLDAKAEGAPRDAGGGPRRGPQGLRSSGQGADHRKDDGTAHRGDGASLGGPPRRAGPVGARKPPACRGGYRERLLSRAPRHPGHVSDQRRLDPASRHLTGSSRRSAGRLREGRNSHRWKLVAPDGRRRSVLGGQRSRPRAACRRGPASPAGGLGAGRGAHCR